MKVKAVEILTAMNGVTKIYTLFLEEKFEGYYALHGNREKIIKFCEDYNVKTFNEVDVEEFLDFCLSQNKIYISF